MTDIAIHSFPSQLTAPSGTELAAALGPALPEQPYAYQSRSLVEPDWRRFPGWRNVSTADWHDPRWQRAHCIKSIAQLRQAVGDLLDESCYADLERDQRERATMSILLPPQMLNTIAPSLDTATRGGLTEAFRADPVRRYMVPMYSDRRKDWPSHPFAERDSLHEQDMWAVEGLTHRYPTKVLAEVVATCPQYCGHCTRMDLVGNSTPQVAKARFVMRPADRLKAMLDYLSATPGVRDVVVSGGDVANLPWPRLEAFVSELIRIPSIRDIRLASKAVVGLPQYWSSDEVRRGMERLVRLARSHDVQLAVHTHANAAQQITPAVAAAARGLLDTGLRDVRNQGVLMSGVNDSVEALLDLSFALLDGAAIMPYYFYLCDMIPFSEHWRTSVSHAQDLQQGILGYLPGFATPRIVCDVPFIGKRWVHQALQYDRERGISYWTKNYRTSLEKGAEEPGNVAIHQYFDPIHTLPESGQDWWRRHAPMVEVD
ncbi:KamA family radical SAM protein [Kitasatospora sp. LaBMicrA B282]|uniref:KamA family radical SAM protein n=1 Tax=Kitasatospora sp. LaBMicrA B282 TaxID=3420949 RepID=UPI003D0D6ED6